MTTSPAGEAVSPRGPLRLVVRSPDGRRVLARPNGVAGWALPLMATPRPFVQWSTDDVRAASAALGTPVVPVRRLSPDAWEVEALERVPAAGNDWVDIGAVDRLGVDAAPARAALAEPTPDTGHLRPGWWADLLGWVAERFSSSEPARLLCHWELSAVVAVPTDDGVVVVKQNGPSFTREAPVLRALGGLPHIPPVLAADDDLVATAWAGIEGADAAAVARALGRLHRAAEDRVPALVAAGCPSTDDLARDIGGHPEQRRAVARHLDVVRGLGFAPTVVHADAHQGNVLVGEGASADEITVIDWTDAVVGEGPLDLLMLLLSSAGPAVTEAVVRSWAEGHASDPRPVLDALPSIRVVGCAVVVGLYELHDADLPPSATGWWAEWTDDWRRRLDEAIADADDGSRRGPDLRG